MTKAAVRRVNEWDGPAMLKIYAPYVGTPAAQETALPALAEYIQRIDRYTYGLGWLICEVDSEPAGFCHLTEDRYNPGDLFSVEFQIYVKPGFRRRGVGTALWSLMRDVMEYGSRKQVFAWVDRENPQALAFFSTMGFSPWEEKEEGGRVRRVFRYALSPADPAAERPVKPYLIESLDYERAREKAASLVKPGPGR